MSVRSFFLAVGVVLAASLSLVTATPVLANSCSFACTAEFIAPGAPGSGSTCTTDTECQRYCATTCGALRSPAAFVDSAHPSTCSGATARTPGACTACSCTPNVPLTCEGTSAGVCATSCNTTCNGYNAARPSGVRSIACATGAAAPSCVPTPPPAPTPAPTPGGASGQCRYSCTFGLNAQIRTATTCTPGTPSSCSASALAADCTRAGLTPSTSVECVNGTGGNKCVITCTRPTTASPAELGTCSGASDNDLCSSRCEALCAGRGMACASGATCAAGGRCAFSCEVITTVTAPPEPTLRCDATQTTASAQQCEGRCIAYCGEHGGVCASSPAPTCVPGDGSAGGTDSNSAGGSNGTTAPNRPPQISRTAPIFHVEFPDPFGGNMKLPQVIGNIIRILVGLCGVFFLGVFVYGGIQYLMSAGETKMVQTGQRAIVNAVIGLVVVLFAYVGVSLVIQISDQLQTGQIAAPDLSQNAQDDGALQPGGTTRATGRSSQDAAAPGSQPGSGTTPRAEAGTPAAACRSYYGADPATCSSGGGGCPVGVTDINGLISAWGRSFPAPSRDIPEPAAACRTCLETGIRGSQGLYPGLTNTCVPALVNLWSTTCHDVCNPRSVESTDRPTTGSDICVVANYNTSNSGCARCISYWSSPTRASTIAEVGCPNPDGKVVVWCAGAESPSRTSRPESGGYCTFTTPRR